MFHLQPWRIEKNNKVIQNQTDTGREKSRSVSSVNDIPPIDMQKLRMQSFS